MDGLVYIIMEYVHGYILYDLCQDLGSMGEDAARFFISQLLETLDYLQETRTAHRDIKLENILVDKKTMGLKLADFGFAAQKQVDCLSSYRGTFTYMAPEIKECKQYCGFKADMFSFGVVLFIITQGFFPFKEAVKHEYFYNLIYTGQIELYFEKVNGAALSPEFKDLFINLMSYDPAKRLTVAEVRAHPWMKATENTESVKKILAKTISKIYSKKTASKKGKAVRA
jgi:serine/threonine protein kinase